MGLAGGRTAHPQCCVFARISHRQAAACTGATGAIAAGELMHDRRVIETYLGVGGN